MRRQSPCLGSANQTSNASQDITGRHRSELALGFEPHVGSTAAMNPKRSQTCLDSAAQGQGGDARSNQAEQHSGGLPDRWRTRPYSRTIRFDAAGLSFGGNVGQRALQRRGDDGPSRARGSIGSCLAAGKDGSVFAIVGGHSLYRRSADGEWAEIANSELELSCCVPIGDAVLVGIDDAPILRVDPDGTQRQLTGFAAVPGRERWYARTAIVDALNC